MSEAELNHFHFRNGAAFDQHHTGHHHGKVINSEPYGDRMPGDRNLPTQPQDPNFPPSSHDRLLPPHAPHQTKNPRPYLMLWQPVPRPARWPTDY